MSTKSEVKFLGVKTICLLAQIPTLRSDIHPKKPVLQPLLSPYQGGKCDESLCTKLNEILTRLLIYNKIRPFLADLGD
jgi:hypothetical protein